MGYGLLNLGSLLFGVIAWVFPVINIGRCNRDKNGAGYSVISLCACAVSLYMQILYSDHLVKIEDWSALMDTSGAVARVSGLLLAVTIILNAATFFMYNKRGRK